MAEQRQHTAAFAKTTRPATATVVARERLFARLDGGPARTIGWISGPPGAGKTSLAASYVEARRLRTIWYQVDPDDADVATFFHYLAHAAAKVQGAAGPDLPAYGTQYGADIAAFSRKFFRLLFARVRAPVALVLDNLHAVPGDSALLVALEAAFTQVPKGSCVVVASRNEPQAALARLRVTGEMVCVSGENLRFEAGELAEMARQRGQALEAESLSHIGERTRGWAAGVVLMLEHAKLAGQLGDYPGEAAPQVIFDYLGGEIFGRFEPKAREFLMRVACLPRMTVAVAEAQSGEPKAGRLLVNLALNDYFVTEAPSDEGKVFQLHPLLREFLLARAAHDLPEAVSPGALRRGAGLLRGAGQVEDAASLLIESHDWEELAALVAGEAEAMIAQGRLETLGTWLGLLPATLVDSDPRLMLALGACRCQSSPRSARRCFERAYAAFGKAADARGMLAACCGAIQALILEFDDLTDLHLWAGRLPGLLARAGADAASSPADDERNTETKLACANAKLLQGDFPGAYALFAELTGRAGELPSRMNIACGVGTAMYHFSTGAHDEALAAARACLATGAAEGIHASDTWLHAVAASALLGKGNRDAAREELLAAGSPSRRGDRALMQGLRAWLALLDGDTTLAAAEARGAAALAAETSMPWLECLTRVIWAQLLGERDDRRGCEAQLRAAAALDERLESPLLRFAVMLAEAAAAMRTEEQGAALEKVSRAFAFGREHDIRHVPGWRPQAVADLCAAALTHGIEKDYVRALVRSRSLVPRASPARVPEWPWPIRVCSFGGFALSRDGAPVEFAAKGPGRPMELLKVLVAMGGQNVRADQLADALWPHVEADYAHNSFTATLHRLRKLVGEDDAIVLRDSRLALSGACIWVDTWTLDQVLADLDEVLRSATGVPPRLEALVAEAFRIYRGPFLPDESEQPAYIACREQVRARLLRCLVRAARCWEEAGQGERAADAYLRCIEADPLFEAPYRNLMLCYQRIGERLEALATYERLRTTLSMRLKVMPSQETQAVLAAVKG